jgi:hypothetical protein
MKPRGDVTRSDEADVGLGDGVGSALFLFRWIAGGWIPGVR